MVKSAFFANVFYHDFPNFMVFSRTKKGRFYHHFQQKTPIFKTPILPSFSENHGKIRALFSIFLETNGKIGLFFNTLNTPKSPILPLFLPKSGCLGTKKSVVEHVANISSAYHDDEYMVNIRSATPFRSTISNARRTRSLGTPMRLNYKHLYTSGRKPKTTKLNRRGKCCSRKREEREREKTAVKEEKNTTILPRSFSLSSHPPIGGALSLE